MDDGSKKGSGLIVNTDSFTEEEVNSLKDILVDRFDLKLYIHLIKNRKFTGYRIYVHAKSIERLFNTLRPFLLPEFFYKFGVYHKDQPTCREGNLKPSLRDFT